MTKNDVTIVAMKKSVKIVTFYNVIPRMGNSFFIQFDELPKANVQDLFHIFNSPEDDEEEEKLPAYFNFPRHEWKYDGNSTIVAIKSPSKAIIFHDSKNECALSPPVWRVCPTLNARSFSVSESSSCRLQNASTFFH